MYDMRRVRFIAVDRVPYFTRMAVSVHFVETDAIEVMATDCHFRVYYNPDGIEKYSEFHVAMIFVHELLHIFLQHDKRSKLKIGAHPGSMQRQVWNIAGDLEINRIIRKMKIANLPPNSGVLPDDGLDHNDRVRFPFPLPDNGTAEEYYDAIMAQQKNVPKSVLDSFMEGASGDSGSGSDGQARVWDLGSPSDGQDDGQGTAPGIDVYDRTELERGVAHAIAEAAGSQDKRRGSIPGDLIRAAETILKPRFDPRKEILAEVKYAMNCIKGFGQTTWKMPNRRTPPNGLRLPANIQPCPQPIVIIDTSSSMNQVDSGLALGVVASVVQCLPSREGVHVITGDTHAGTCQRVFGASSVQLVGGGGTNMGAIMVQACKDFPRADVMLVVTDGMTPWPRDPLPPKCLALITDQQGRHDTPSWIREIFIRGK